MGNLVTETETPEVIKRTSKTPGMYAVTTPALPNIMVPIYVDGQGRTRSMKKDEVLHPARWAADVQVSGPLTPDSVKI